MVKKYSSSNMMNLAQELQTKELHIDAYLQPILTVNEGSHMYGDGNPYKFSPITLTKQGFPVHKLLLASVSPFFKSLFQDHYSDHRESVVTVLLPETSAFALRHVIQYIYTSNINIPLHLHSEVYNLAKNLQINSLLHELNPDANIPNRSLCSKQYTYPLSKIKRGRNIKINYDNLNFVNSLKNKKNVKRKYDSNIHELESALTKEKNVKYTHNILLPHSKEAHNMIIDKPNCEEGIKKTNHVYNEGYLKGIICEKNLVNKLDLHSAKYWLHTESGTECNRNLLYVEPNHKIDNIHVSNVSTSQSVLNSISLPQSTETVLFSDNQPIEAGIPMQISQPKTSNLSLINLPADPFSVVSFSVSSGSTEALLPSDKSLARDPFKEETHALFSSTSEEQIGSYESNLHRSQEQEEEEKLKLQVLLKECEGLELGGRSFPDRPSTPTKHLISPGSLESSVSDDFADKIDQWIHCDSTKKTFGSESPMDTVDIKLRKEVSKASSPFEVRSFPKPKEVSLESSPSCHKSQPAPHNAAIQRPKQMQQLKNLSCTECEFVAESESGLRAHRKEAHKVLKCKVCSKVFQPRHAADLLLHEARHSSPTLPCKNCPKVFKLKKDLKAHMKRYEGRPKFKCEACGKLLCSRRSLEAHVATVHEKKKPFKCDLCSKAYTKEVLLKVHIRSTHTYERPYKCSVCPKTFASTDLLSIHKSSHSSKCRFMCAICKKGFKTFANLFTHKKIHVKEKIFTCNVCKLQLKCHLTMLKHQLTHKRLSPPLKCRYCDQTFDIKEQYETHMLSIHGEKVKIPEINLKKFTARSTKSQTTNFTILNSPLPSAPESPVTLNLTSFVTKNSKPVRLLHLPTSRTKNTEIINKAPNFKLTESTTNNTSSFLKSSNNKFILIDTLPLSHAMDGSGKTASSVADNSNLLLTADYLQYPQTSSISRNSKVADHFLQIPDVKITEYRPPSTRNFYLADKTPKQNTGFLGEKSAGSKCSGGLDYKLVEHNLTYEMNEAVFSEPDNGDKSESNFLDAFSADCPNEDNVDKFLFEDISSFVE